MLVKLTMSKAFAWGNQPGEKQKEVMTPSAASSTGQEPKIHHGSSTWFSPSTATGYGSSSQPKSFSQVVKGAKAERTMDESLDLIKPNPNKVASTSSKNEKEVESKRLELVATELELVLPMEETKKKRIGSMQNQTKVLKKMKQSTMKKIGNVQ